MLSLTALHLYPLRQPLNLELTDWTSWLTNEFHGLAYLPYFCLMLKNAFMQVLIYLYNMCIQAHTYHGAGLLLVDDDDDDGISAHAPQSCSTHSLPCLPSPQKRSILCCLYIHWGMTKFLVVSPMHLSSHLYRSHQLKRALWRPEQTEVSSPEPIPLHALQCCGLGASSPVRCGISSPVPLPLLASQPHPHSPCTGERQGCACFFFMGSGYLNLDPRVWDIPSEPSSSCLSLPRLEEIKVGDTFVYSSDNGDFYMCVSSSTSSEQCAANV